MRQEFDLRNFPLNRLREYLAQVGGVVDPVNDRVIQGPSWTATLEAAEPVYVGSIRVVRDWLIIEGADEFAAPVIEHMRRMTMRGGG